MATAMPIPVCNERSRWARHDVDRCITVLADTCIALMIPHTVRISRRRALCCRCWRAPPRPASNVRLSRLSCCARLRCSCSCRSQLCCRSSLRARGPLGARQIRDRNRSSALERPAGPQTDPQRPEGWGAPELIVVPAVAVRVAHQLHGLQQNQSQVARRRLRASTGVTATAGKPVVLIMMCSS